MTKVPPHKAELRKKLESDFKKWTEAGNRPYQARPGESGTKTRPRGLEYNERL